MGYAPLAEAFDIIAPDYDAVYGSNIVMQWMRRESLSILEAKFPAGSRLLEIGCGTGEEAVYMAGRGCHIHAIDVSPIMVEITRQKAERAGIGDRVTTQTSPAGGLSKIITHQMFDGAYTSFGALNCEPNLDHMAESLSTLLNPGAYLVCSVMAQFCPFEIGWYALRGKPHMAFRRLKRGWQNAGVSGADGQRTQVAVRYLNVKLLRQAFMPAFRVVERIGFPVLLPPPYLDEIYKRHTNLWRHVELIERSIRSVWPFATMGDHLVVVMQRV